MEQKQRQKHRIFPNKSLQNLNNLQLCQDIENGLHSLIQQMQKQPNHYQNYQTQINYLLNLSLQLRQTLNSSQATKSNSNQSQHQTKSIFVHDFQLSPHSPHIDQIQEIYINAHKMSQPTSPSYQLAQQMKLYLQDHHNTHIRIEEQNQLKDQFYQYPDLTCDDEHLEHIRYQQRLYQPEPQKQHYNFSPIQEQPLQQQCSLQKNDENKPTINRPDFLTKKLFSYGCTNNGISKRYLRKKKYNYLDQIQNH